MSSQPSFKPQVLSSIMNIIEKETRYLQNCQNNSKNVSEAICQKHKIERRLSGPLIYKYILLFKTSINISIFLNRPCNLKKLAYFRGKCCFTLQFHFTYIKIWPFWKVIFWLMHSLIGRISFSIFRKKSSLGSTYLSEVSLDLK